MSRVYYGWWIVVVAFAAMVAGTPLGPSAFSVFLVPMSEDLGWRRDLIAGGLAAGTLAGAAVAPSVGRLVDRHGARVMLTLGGVGLTVSMLGIAATPADAPWVFYLAYGLGRMIDMAVVLLGATTAVSAWFTARRGRALGIVLAGNAAAVVVLVPLAQWIIDQSGWRTAWVALGIGLGGLLTPLAWWLVRRSPADLGLEVEGKRAADGGHGAHARHTPAVHVTLRQAVRTRAFWALLLSATIAQCAFAAAGTHQIAYLRDNGLSATAAALAISVYGLVWGVGEVVWGFASERAEPRLALAAAYGAFAAAMLTIVAATSLPLALLYGVLLGLALSGHEAVDAAAWPAYFGTRWLGTIRGAGRPLMLGGNAAGTVLAGYVYESSGSYSGAFVAFAVLAAIACVLVLAARPIAPAASA